MVCRLRLFLPPVRVVSQQLQTLLHLLTCRCSELCDTDNFRGEWCNVAPAGFGIKPGTAVDNPFVDSIVWIKPGGESDGQCGMEGAPRAGQWFAEYAQMLVENADPSITV